VVGRAGLEPLLPTDVGNIAIRFKANPKLLNGNTGSQPALTACAGDRASSLAPAPTGGAGLPAWGRPENTCKVCKRASGDED
jgi:hypothetical protein